MEEKMQHDRTRNRVNNIDDNETDTDITATEDITLTGGTDSMVTTTTVCGDRDDHNYHYFSLMNVIKIILK